MIQENKINLMVLKSVLNHIYNYVDLVDTFKNSLNKCKFKEN